MLLGLLALASVASARDGSGAPDDHGDTPETATPLRLGERIAGEVETPDDKDYFRLDISRAVRVAVWLTATAEEVRLLNRAGTELEPVHQIDAWPLLLRYELEPGRFFIEVSLRSQAPYYIGAIEDIEVKFAEGALQTAVQEELERERVKSATVTSGEMAA